MGTTGGDLSEIRQFYVQNGKAIAHGSPSFASGADISDEFCAASKSHFDEKDEFTAKGGLKQMGESFKNGMTLVLSLWDDPMSHMVWLDSTQNGVERGSCPTSAGDPSTLREQYAVRRSATPISSGVQSAAHRVCILLIQLQALQLQALQLQALQLQALQLQAQHQMIALVAR